MRRYSDWDVAVLTAFAPLKARTGKIAFRVVPSPNRPFEFWPHAQTSPDREPSVRRAREWLAPAAMAITPRNELTWTGLCCSIVVPSPSWP